MASVILGVDGLLVIGANTNVANAPPPTSIAVASSIQVTLNGYGVVFLKLK